MIEIIAATGLIALILLVIGFKLDDKHQVLKVLSVFFAIYCILILAKFGLDSKEVCVRELKNDEVINIYGNNFTSSQDNAEHWTPANDPKPTTTQLTNIGNLVLLHYNKTNYYETVCYNQTNSNTPNTVYNSSLWYFRIVFIYVFGFIIYLVGTYLIKLNEMRKAP